MKNTQNFIFKKALVMLMAVMMVFTMMPSMAWAAEQNNAVGVAEGENQGKAEYGYVTDISFGLNQNGTTEPQNPSGYQFNVETTSYDLAMTGLFNGQNPVKITVYDSFATKTGSEQLYAAIYLDDNKMPLKIANRKLYTPLANKDKEFANGVGQLKQAIKIGEKHKLTIRVGQLNDVSNPNNGFKNYDEYVYNISQKLKINSLNVSANGVNMSISPSFRNGDTTNTVYSVLCENEKIALTCTTDNNYSTAGVKLYAGETELALNSQNEIALEPFMQGDSGIAVIPLLIREKEENAQTETRYTLNVCKEDVSPVIHTQPQDMDIDKDNTVPLTVEAEEPKTGTLSYQWYKTDASGSLGGTAKIEGANQKEYLPDAKYAGTYWYKCRVTNTVGSYTCFTDTNIAKVAVSMNRLGAPEFKGAPTNFGNMNSIGYYSNAMPIIDISMDNIENGEKTKEGAAISVALYRNSKNSNEGGELVQCETFYAQPTYTFALPSQEISGDWYYYVVATASLDGYEDVSAASTTLKLNYKDPKQVVKGLDGDGTTAKPFLIKELKDLNYVKELIKDGFSFDGQTIQLTKDLKLPIDWEPIGVLKSGMSNEGLGANVLPFMGILDGSGHTVTVAKEGKPLFNYVRRATIKNLNIYGEHIKGYGLIDKYYIDYGENGTYIDNKLKLRTVNIEKTVIKKDSKILKAGFIGGYASGVNTVNIKDCIAEKGVVIGDDGSWDDLGDTKWGYPYVTDSQEDGFVNEEYFTHKDCIGSFGGAFNGTINNSISYATVYGGSFVGGLIGMKGQSMGPGDVTNSAFCGKIIASGKRIGGILGGAYIAPSAPLTPPAVVKNSYAACDIETSDSLIGGIVGAGYTLADNCFFYGNLKAESGKSPIGTKGVNNFYLDTCGSSAESDEYGIKATAKEFADGTILEKLSKTYPNWQQDEKYPIVNEKPVISGIVLKGGYKTTYYVGDSLSTNGLKVYAHWTDGNETALDLDKDGITIEGFNSKKAGHYTLTVKYKVFTTTYDIDVKYQNPKGITAYITIYGDYLHNSDEDGEVHTLSGNNLKQWVRKTEVPINQNTTVRDVLEQVAAQNKITLTIQPNSKYGYYVQGMTYQGDYLGEFTNGKLTGWMYTVNGTHPQMSAGYYVLSDGDNIVWHYTDDYTKEEGSDKWGIPSSGAVEEVKDVTTDTKTGTTTAPTEVKVSEKTNADGTKTKVADVKVSADNQKEILKQVKEKKSNEIILVVSSKSVGDAAKADVTLDKSFIDSIVKDTDAKLTIRTPFGDKTYTQDELKAMSEATSGSTVTVAIEKAAEQPTDDNAAKIEKAKSIVKNMKLVARSSKTAKKNIKAVLKNDAKVKASIKELKDLGFTVKYRFYRSTKKVASYKSTVTKKTATYTNTSGKKGTKYFYKVQVRVYDENGKLVAKTALKQCKYASRTWSK